MGAILSYGPSCWTFRVVLVTEFGFDVFARCDESDLELCWVLSFGCLCVDARFCTVSAFCLSIDLMV